jgi:hypothetical protein
LLSSGCDGGEQVAVIEEKLVVAEIKYAKMQFVCKLISCSEVKGDMSH